jgi:hypothetical protein
MARSDWITQVPGPPSMVPLFAQQDSPMPESHTLGTQRGPASGTGAQIDAPLSQSRLVVQGSSQTPSALFMATRPKKIGSSAQTWPHWHWIPPLPLHARNSVGNAVSFVHGPASPSHAPPELVPVDDPVVPPPVADPLELVPAEVVAPPDVPVLVLPLLLDAPVLLPPTEAEVDELVAPLALAQAATAPRNKSPSEMRIGIPGVTVELIPNLALS